MTEKNNWHGPWDVCICDEKGGCLSKNAFLPKQRRCKETCGAGEGGGMWRG